MNWGQCLVVQAIDEAKCKKWNQTLKKVKRINMFFAKLFFLFF